MECIVNKASMYTLYYVDIVDSAEIFSLVYYDDIDGGGEFFESRSQRKSARVIFLLTLCFCKCGITLTRFHAFMSFAYNLLFFCWVITKKNYGFSNQRGILRTCYSVG